MADILIQSPVPSLFPQAESASNLIVNLPIEDSTSANKYNGHVNRLRQTFVDNSFKSSTLNSDKQSTITTNDDHPTQFRQTKEMFQTLDSSSMSNPRQESAPIHVMNTSTSSTHSISEQHYDFPADAIEQFKKRQQHDDTDSINSSIHEPTPTRFVPLLLPTNTVKRMDHLNTVFIKPTKIEQPLPKQTFLMDEKPMQIEYIEPDYDQNDDDDDDKSSSLLFYEKPGLSEDDDDDDVRTRRVKFSTAPIRVYSTYSRSEYDRRNESIDPYAASAEYELEKRIEKMDVFTMEIERGPDGLGMSVLGMGVGADSGLEKLGIFVKSFQPNGMIAKDGRMQIGDQIIEVNDQSLVGVTHSYATGVLKATSGVVRFVVGRAKDTNSEVLSLVERSLKIDREREEMSRTFQQYHDAYYEQNFNDRDSLNKDDEIVEHKISQEFQMEILKQCYESLEKTLENTEKEKQQFQALYQQTEHDLKQIEEKYLQAQQLIHELQERETELRQQQTVLNEQQEKRIQELMKKIEELEGIIASSNVSQPTTNQRTLLTGRNTIATSSIRVPSVSMDKISAHSQENLEPRPCVLTSSRNQSTDQISTDIDQHVLVKKTNGTKSNAKHLSTPSLRQLSNDSELITSRSPISKVPSLERASKDSLDNTTDLSTKEYVEIKDWSTDQCIQWLTAQEMTSIIPIFLNWNISGEKLLLLDGSKMKAMGIKSSKDRDQLKSKIKELKHAELHRLRERLLNQPSSHRSVLSGNHSRSSSLSKLRERKFFSNESLVTMSNGPQSNTHARRTNYSYIEDQNEARTELLNSKVSQLKHLAVQIGEETKFQNKYLKELHDNMDYTDSLISQARRRVLLLARSGGWKIYVYLFLFTLFVLLVIYFLMK